ncbi:MAG: SCP2 sterol-binding domain-containing protein [Chloroflexota bacterium]|nr:SCP2 sterol-binding domain-containing protein [Chloroflexota bacterium]
MAVFESERQLYAVLQDVFDRLIAEPATIEAFTHSNLVIRMNFTDPAAQALLDGRQPPLEVFFGETPGQANMEFTMPADLLHRIWMGEESASEAFFSGRIQTQGNFMKAMKLLDLFRECERVYPDVAAEHNLA